MYNCRIYKLCNTEDDKIYIGSTKQGLGERMAGHRGDARRGKNRRICQYIRELGVEKFYIEELESKEVEDRQGQMKLETVWISKLNPVLNMRPAYLSQEQRATYTKEYSKRYGENNKEAIKIKNKINRNKDPEKTKLRNKEWYAKNLGYGKEYYTKNKDRMNEYRRGKHNSEKNKARCRAYRERKRAAAQAAEQSDSENSDSD